MSDVAVQDGQHRDDLVRASTALSVISILSVLSSFLWDLAIAWRFGISASSDAFYFAFMLPSIITSLAYLSAYSILMPTVTKLLSTGAHDEAWRLFSIVTNVVLVSTVVISLAGILSSYILPALLAPGFNDNTLHLAAQMNLIMFATLVAAVGFEVFRTGLYAVNRVVLPAVLTTFGNLIIVAFIVIAGPSLGIHSAAFGVAAAKIVQFCVIAMLLIRVPGFQYHWSLRLSTPGVMRTLRGFLSPITGMGSRRIVIVLERMMASTLPSGSITALSLGNRLGTVVGTVYYDSVTTALLPALSRQVSACDWARVRDSMLLGIKLVTFVSLPAVIILVLLRDPITGLLFEHGLVTAESASLTAGILAIYAVSLLPMGQFRVLQNYFFAAEQRVLVAGLFGLAAFSNITLDLILIQVWGANGIAAAFALSSVIVTFVGYVLMWPRIGGWPTRELSTFVVKSGLAGLLCAATVFAVQAAWPSSYEPVDTITRAAYVAAAGGLGSLVYLMFGLIAEPQETRRTFAMVTRKLGPRGSRSRRPGAAEGEVGASPLSASQGSSVTVSNVSFAAPPIEAVIETAFQPTKRYRLIHPETIDSGLAVNRKTINSPGETNDIT